MPRPERVPELLAILRKMIVADELASGSPVPHERDLASQYGFSRTVVRKALAVMEQEGLLLRIPGRGALVQVRKVLKRVAWFGEWESHLFGQRQFMPTVGLNWQLALPTLRQKTG